MRVTGMGQGTLQIPDHVFDRPVLFARNRSQGAPVVRLRLDSDSVEQQGRGHMVRVRDERHAHPGADRLILTLQVVGVPPCPERENERPGNGHAKGYRQNQ